MSKWFWILSMQQAIAGGRGARTTTVASECDLPDGISRMAVFQEIQKAAIDMADWEGGVTVLFFSLEPAALPVSAAPESAHAAGGVS